MSTPPFEPTPHEPGDERTRWGTIETVALFRRADYMSDDLDSLSLAHVARTTFGLDWSWEDGPDFGIATVAQPDGARVTWVSFDVDYLAMVKKAMDDAEEDEGEDIAKIPGDKFEFYMHGWPEEWPGSGLAKIDE